MKMPSELLFLQGHLDLPEKKLRTPAWLLTDFDSNTWEYSFNFISPKSVSWEVHIDNESLLTAPQNKELLDSLKYYLTCCTQRIDEESLDASAIKNQAKLFSSAAHIIDFILINSSTLQLSKYGIAGINKDELKHILEKASIHKNASEWVYDWKSKLSSFCLRLLNSTDPIKIHNALRRKPSLSTITSEQEEQCSLDIPLTLVPNIRAALYVNGFYHAARLGFSPNTAKISKLIYKDTLRGLTEQKPIEPILTFKDELSFVVREFPTVPIKNTETEYISHAQYNMIRKTIYNLGYLHEIGLPAPPIEDLQEIKNFNVKTNRPGRFKSAPAKIVFGAIREAIELHLTHGKEIVNAFCRVALASMRDSAPLTAYSDAQIVKIVGPHLADLGVRQLGLSCNTSGKSYEHNKRKHGTENHFNRLRSNFGLIELLSIYIGAVQIVTGGLTARRADELIKLQTNDCLDDTEQWLIFENCKSTRLLYGIRKSEARPIEPIAVDMIKNLVRMQNILKRIGFVDDSVDYLFSSPYRLGAKGLAPCSQYSLDANFDIFCDYIQTDLDNNGRRYYLRQHQLRRFFAMLFFHSSSIGGLETLQWMLGQTEISHVWNYITESLDGAALRGAKAQYLAEKINEEGESNYKNLSNLIKSRYGTEKFSIADTHELESYLSDLLDEGLIDIEPEFFENHSGEQMRIILKIKGIAQCQNQTKE